MTQQTIANPLRVIISGGGTAGHIHPALAVADALRERLGADGVEILFVGAEGKMEMARVPKAGYPIEGLPVAGLQRRLTLSNLKLPFKVWNSLRRAGRIIRAFRPDVVVGFGGYASAPVLWVAQNRGIPTLIQEQNSYAGLTNRLLARRAKRICVAYDGMERFFDASKILLTGNPLRIHFSELESKREEAIAHFGLAPNRRTILVVGGSLGTRTLNETMLRWLDRIESRDDLQVIWQSGAYYEPQMIRRLAGRTLKNVWRGSFVERMDLAYAAADLVVSRAGAGTVSELELVGRPVIFVPSPNVAEDHQTKNAQALVSIGAARLVSDAEAAQRVMPEAFALLDDAAARAEMIERILRLGRPDAARTVAEEVIKLARDDKR